MADKKNHMPSHGAIMPYGGSVADGNGNHILRKWHSVPQFAVFPLSFSQIPRS